MAARTTPRPQSTSPGPTADRLVHAARARFGRDGFAGTSLDAVVADCGVTKGSFYHHFDSKTDLFAAVFEAQASDLAAGVAKAYKAKRDPWRGALAGLHAFLEACLDPEVQRIELDAPSVLGPERMRAIEARYGLALVVGTLEALRDRRELGRHDVDFLAHLLFAATSEAAYYVARADDPPAAKRRMERELRLLLDDIRRGA